MFVFTRIFFFVLVVLLALPMTACSDNIVSWQEEVKLNDGRVITITQKRKCEQVYDGHSVNSCLAREAWMTFTLPEISSTPIEWHQRLKPQVLNIDNGKLFVIGRPPTSREDIEWGHPRAGYVQFVYESAAWKRIDLSEVPQSIYDSNLLINMLPPESTKLLKLDEKQKLNAHHLQLNSQKRVDPTLTNTF